MKSSLPFGWRPLAPGCDLLPFGCDGLPAATAGRGARGGSPFTPVELELPAFTAPLPDAFDVWLAPAPDELAVFVVVFVVIAVVLSVWTVARLLGCTSRMLGEDMLVKIFAPSGQDMSV